MKRLPEATLQAIGAEVQRRREAAGMSTVGLGERAELSHQYISRLELGQVRTRLRHRKGGQIRTSGMGTNLSEHNTALEI